MEWSTARSKSFGGSIAVDSTVDCHLDCGATCGALCDGHNPLFKDNYEGEQLVPSRIVINTNKQIEKKYWQCLILCKCRNCIVIRFCNKFHQSPSVTTNVTHKSKTCYWNYCRQFLIDHYCFIQCSISFMVTCNLVLEAEVFWLEPIESKQIKYYHNFRE